MPITKYRAFLKVVESNSISRAAEQLGYTQSAISRMIADLENEWQVILLQRSRAGLSLTSEGIVLLPQIREVCRQQEILLEKVGQLNGLTCGLIRVGAFVSVAAHWLPFIIQRFQQRYPEIEFQILSGEYTDILGWLASGEVDCGFVCAPFPQSFSVHYLHRDRRLAVIPEDHRYAEAAVFPIAALADEPFIKAREKRDQEISHVIESLGFPLRIAYEADDDYAIQALVECGLGVGILPELVTERTAFRIRCKPFDRPQFRDIGLAVKDEAHCSDAVRAFMETVKDYIHARYPDETERD